MSDRQQQPWTSGDTGVGIDRAFVRELMQEMLDKQERNNLEREERFKNYLQWLSLRWALIWAAILFLIWAIRTIYFAVNYKG